MSNIIEIYKRRHSKDAPSQSLYQEGDRVLVRYKGRRKIYTGEILVVNEDFTYNILYDDNDMEEHVSASNIQGIDDQKLTTFEIGDKIEARKKHKSKWVDGEVIQVLGHHRYDIQYEDGTNEAKMHAAYMKMHWIESPRIGDNAEQLSRSFSGSNSKDIVKSVFGQHLSRRGSVSSFSSLRINVNAPPVPAAIYGFTASGYISAPCTPSNNDTHYSVGNTVVYVNDILPYYTNKVLGYDEQNNTYTLKSMDGCFTIHDKVSPTYLVPIHHRKIIKYFPGERVLAQFLKDNQWLSGYIIKYDEELQLYNVLFDNNIELKCNSLNITIFPKDIILQTFEQGDEILTTYNSYNYVAGKIIQLEEYDRYDIKLDNGENFVNVHATFIYNPVEDETETYIDDLPCIKPIEEIDELYCCDFEYDDIILGKYSNSDTWYKGKIIDRNEDAIYSVLFDDGDVEKDVKEEDIKRYIGVEEYHKFDRVLCRVNKKYIWKLAVIWKEDEKVKDEYQVMFDDGKLEEIDIKDLCILPSYDYIASRKYQIGDKVLSRYCFGNNNYYPGVIEEENNDHYTIKFEDGDRKENLYYTFIKAYNKNYITIEEKQSQPILEGETSINEDGKSENNRDIKQISLKNSDSENKRPGVLSPVLSVPSNYNTPSAALVSKVNSITISPPCEPKHLCVQYVLNITEEPIINEKNNGIILSERISEELRESNKLIKQLREDNKKLEDQISLLTKKMFEIQTKDTSKKRTRKNNTTSFAFPPRPLSGSYAQQTYVFTNLNSQNQSINDQKRPQSALPSIGYRPVVITTGVAYPLRPSNKKLVQSKENSDSHNSAHISLGSTSADEISLNTNKQ